MKKILFSLFIFSFLISCSEEMANNGGGGGGNTPSNELFNIAKTANPEEIRAYLSDHPETVNGQDPENGNTALAYVIEEGYKNNPEGVVESIDVLLENQADPNIKNDLGETSLIDTAISAGEYEDPATDPSETVFGQVATLLLQTKDSPSINNGVLVAKVNLSDQDGKTALHHSVTKGTLAQAAITKKLGIKMNDIDTIDSKDETPLDIAVIGAREGQGVTPEYDAIFRTLCSRTENNYYTSDECQGRTAGSSKSPSSTITTLLEANNPTEDVFTALASYISDSPQSINYFLGSAGKGLLSSSILGIRRSDDNDMRDPIKNVIYLLDAGASIDQQFKEDRKFDNKIVFSRGSVTEEMQNIFKYELQNDSKDILDVIKIMLKQFTSEQLNASREPYGSLESYTLFSSIVSQSSDIAFEAFQILIKDPRLNFNILVGPKSDGLYTLDFFLKDAKPDTDNHYQDKLKVLCENTDNAIASLHTECEPFI